MTRPNRPLTVTLGPYLEKAEARVASGQYASVSEVIRAGLRALDWEDEARMEVLRRRIEEAEADPRPSKPMNEVFNRLEAKYRAMSDAADEGS
ncbi:MAG: type II toxin-antitoxin system ParD family antitoxin [Caulobacter sp.]|nr:type II toxin-antitoxin system ParD family antitoxin [Caulobacter sp.]